MKEIKGLGRKRKSESQCDERTGGTDEDAKKKKVRTTFTGKQIYELERMFEAKKYLSSSERSELAKLLKVTEQQASLFRKKLQPLLELKLQLQFERENKSLKPFYRWRFSKWLPVIVIMFKGLILMLKTNPNLSINQTSISFFC